MKRSWRQFLLVMFGCLAAMAVSARAQDVFNIPLVEQKGRQHVPRVIPSDAARGYFVFWIDERSGLPEIYGQFLSENGYTIWAPEGRKLVSRRVPILNYSVAPDGEGGVFIAWTEKSSTGIGTVLYLGRMNADGEPLWANPVVLGRAGLTKLNARCIYDLDRGVYVVWEQSLTPTDVDIFAQHVDATGRKLWPAGGMVVVNTDNAVVLEDAEAMIDGLAVAWQNRSSVFMQILAFKTGKAVSSSPLRPSIISLNQARPRLARRQSSSESSVFLVWQEGTNLRAQRFSSEGERLWGSVGVDVIRATGTQSHHEILGDARGGLIVVWQDTRDVRTGIDLRAQRLDKGGDVQWNSNGVILNSAVNTQAGQKMIADPNDGIVTVWEDSRLGELNLYAQRINRSGRLKWPIPGVAVSKQPGAQRDLQLATLGEKVLAIWVDERQDAGDIFGQFIQFDGTLHNVLPYFTSIPIDTAYVGRYYEYALQANDVDRDFPLTFNPVVLPDWLDFDDENNTLSGIVANIVGEVSLVSVEVIDARGGIGKQTFEIRVLNMNHPPKIVSQPDTVAIEDSLYVYELVIDDPDTNDAHTLDLIELPDWLGVEEDAFRLVGVPQNQDVGLHRVSLIVKDLAGETAQQEFTIRVVNSNDPPQFLTAATADTAIEDEDYRFEFDLVDPDVGDSLTLTFLSQPSWLRVDSDQRALVGVPTNDHLGDTLVVLQATDLAGAADTLFLQLYVQNTNDPPFFVSAPVTEAVVDSLYEYAVVVDDVDPDETLRLFFRTGPAWLNLNPTHFVLSGIPPQSAANDSFEVVLEVEDASGATAQQAYWLYVREQAIPDSVPPPGPINPAVVPNGWTAADSLTLRWITPADQTGITRIFIKYGSPPQHNDDYEFTRAIRTAAGAMDSLRFPALLEGEHSIYVWFADRKGNADFQTAVAVRYRVDRTAPVPPQPLFPEEWSRGDTVRFVWLAARDSVSGIKEYLISVKPDNQLLRVTDFSPEADTLSLEAPLHLSEKLVDWIVVAIDSAENTAKSGVRSFSVDNVVPLVIHTPVDTLPAGKPATFTARVTDIGSGVKSVYLLYRFPDQSRFNRLQMTTEDGVNYAGTLRGVDITAAGLEYAIVAFDFAENRKFWQASDQISVYRSPVILGPAVPIPIITRQMKYQMFGIPYYLAENDPKTFFEQQLGPYDDTQWRLLRYQNGGYVELTEGQIDSLLPGRAYWLITRESRQLQTSELATVRSDRPFRLILQPGWNMIASPFNFTIRFDPTRVPDGVEPVLWGFDGNQYRMENQKMTAWKGYFIKNNQAGVVEWPIYPEKVAAAKPMAPWAETTWYARLIVQQGDRRDAENLFGQAEPAGDALNWSEPPAIGDTPRLYFTTAEDSETPRAFASAFLRADLQNPVWRVRLDNLAEGWVHLQLEIGKSWADSLRLWVVDQTTGIEREWRPEKPLTFWNATAGGNRTLELRLLPENEIASRRTLPSALHLYPIRPNPFRVSQSPQMTIRFALVQPERVRVAVYNVLGQEIWATPELTFQEGEHAITWNGQTRYRTPAPSGVYFVHVQVLGQSQRLRRKIVLLR